MCQSRSGVGGFAHLKTQVCGDLKLVLLQGLVTTYDGQNTQFKLDYGGFP